MKKLSLILTVCVLFFAVLQRESKACSTFLLKSETGLFVGHNLDESVGFEIPGMVIINKRNVYKKGRSWDFFFTPGKKEKPSPALRWVSKYGSVTFNNRGRDFPDGGMNEAGLTIFEMSLKGSQFKEDKSLPSLLIELWVQYQLDNFETVEQVIKSTSEIMVDGRTWHFLVSDKNGNSAAIEFIKGEVVVHTGAAMPVTALCNSSYSYEIKRLKNYAGFGGSKPIPMSDKKIPRFVHAASMLAAYNKTVAKPAVDYSFAILEHLHEGRSNSWENKWSIVLDVKNLTVYLNTYRNREIRYFSLKSFDLSCDKPVRILDIDTRSTGDVTKNFVDYSYEFNFKFVKAYDDAQASFFKNYTKSLAEIGLTSQMLVERFAGYPGSTVCKNKQ